VLYRSGGSSVNIVAELRAGRPGFDSQQEQEYFLFAAASRQALRSTRSLIQWVPGPLSAGVKRPYIFMAWYLVKHRGSFTFTLPCYSGSQPLQIRGSVTYPCYLEQSTNLVITGTTEHVYLYCKPQRLDVVLNSETP